MALEEDNLLMPPQYADRYLHRRYGKYRAMVVDTDDPQRLGRVKVMCPVVYGSKPSPWATVMSGPLGASPNRGEFLVPKKNTHVFIEFEQGMPTYPIVVGSVFSAVSLGMPSDGSELESSAEYQAATSPVPKHALGKIDGYDGAGTSRGEPGVPPSRFAGKYPHVYIKSHDSGRLEFDDTPGEERVLLAHHIGSALEFGRAGTVDLVSTAKMNKSVVGEKYYNKGTYQGTVLNSYTLAVGGPTDLYLSEVSATAPEVTLDFHKTVLSGSSVTVEVDRIDLATLGEFSLVSSNLSLATLNEIGIVASGPLEALGSSMDPSQYDGTALLLEGKKGKIELVSIDVTEKASRYGLVAQAQSTLLGNVVASLADTGPYVFIGNTGSNGAAKEPLVLGNVATQLFSRIIGAINAYAGTLSSGGSTPGFGGPNPVLAQASVTLVTELQSIISEFIVPSSPMGYNKLVSDTVFTSKT